MTEELWKVVEGFPDYSVSNLGRVISRRTSKEKFIGSHVDKKSGYSIINLRNDDLEGDYRTSVHREVARAFVEDPDPTNGKRIVNHISGDPTDNRAVNLEWCTYSENLTHPNCHRKRSKEVVRIDVQNGSIKIFLNASVAARSVGGRASTIWQKCNKVHNKLEYLGYFWEWA